MEIKTTTTCLNGELKPGDLVLSSPKHDYASLVGTVLRVSTLWDTSQKASEDSKADIVHVNFLDADYPEERIYEIQDMLGEMYGRPTTPGIWPPVDIEDVGMPPSMLIRITDIDRNVLRSVVGSRESAEQFFIETTAHLDNPLGYATEKLYSPLFIKIRANENKAHYNADYQSDPLPQDAAVCYADDIHTTILNKRLSGGAKRGLMDYFYGSDVLDFKIHSLFVDVEVHAGKLWSVATIETLAPLSSDEYAVLKDFITSHYSDGLNGFERRPVSVEDGELYVSLWSSGKEFFIDTQHEFDQRLGFTPFSVQKSGEVPEETAQVALRDTDIPTDTVKHATGKRPSVMAELRDAAKSPEEPHRGKPTKNRGGHEH